MRDFGRPNFPQGDPELNAGDAGCQEGQSVGGDAENRDPAKPVVEMPLYMRTQYQAAVPPKNAARASVHHGMDFEDDAEPDA